MATFRFGRDVNMKWNGNEIVGPAGTIFRIEDAYYNEFNSQVGNAEPTLEWIETNEFQALQNSVSVTTLEGVAPIVVASVSSGRSISLNANYATSTHDHSGVYQVSGSYATSTHDHSGTYQPAGTYVTAVNGTAPINASTNTAGVATLSLSANYATSTHDHSGVYVTSVSGTAPISASTTTAGATTVSVSTGVTSATVALGDHIHTGVYQPSGTYVTAVNGTAPITASTNTAGIVTVGLGASYASSVHAHATSDVTSGNFVATLAAGTGVTVTGADGNASAKTVAIGQAVATSDNVTFNQVTASDYIKLSGWNQAAAGNDASANTVTVTTAGTYYAIGGSSCEVSFTPDFVGQDFFVTVTGYASLNTTTVQYCFVRVDVNNSTDGQIAVLGYGRSDNFGTSGRGGTVALNKIWVADSTSARKIKLYGTTQTTNGLVLSLSYWQINVMALA